MTFSNFSFKYIINPRIANLFYMHIMLMGVKYTQVYLEFQDSHG